MAKKMLIDASHREEVRMAIVDGNRLEDFEVENIGKNQLKSNVYLAKVIRIEPSLQAAFVDFGGNRQGFLPFAEIHPDYFQIPVSDRAALKKEVEESAIKEEEAEDDLDVEASEGSESSDAEGEPKGESPSDDIEVDEDEPRKRNFRYRYKIQEVIKRRQIMLVQVVKEERGGKGAALTTYLSLAGRYCVLMTNSGERRGGVSRKISDVSDRKRLRAILDGLDIPESMSLIVRTAGSEKNKADIKRDFEYLLREWSSIREKTLESVAPALICAEGDLVKRALRDSYSNSMDEIIVEGEQSYKDARALMKSMMPSHVKKVQLYKDPAVSLFQKYRVESQIDQIFQSSVVLPSGGSIVIGQTEALVAIDVNSGKATKERHIDDTALKTNIEAAKEVARQLRLRDLAGLIVIDFIDMHDRGHIAQVERVFRDALSMDRARIQTSKISQFGLLEMSRQRLRPSVLESNTSQCPHCLGSGVVRSVDSMALFVLRQIETAATVNSGCALGIAVPEGVDLYLLNQKRRDLVEIETQYSVTLMIRPDKKLKNTEYQVEVQKSIDALKDFAKDVEEEEPRDKSNHRRPVEKNDQKDQRPRHQDRQKEPRHQGKAVEVSGEDEVDVIATDEQASGAPSEERTSSRSAQRRNRRRNRNKNRPQDGVAGENVGNVAVSGESVETSVTSDEVKEKNPESSGDDAISGGREERTDGRNRRRRSRFGKRRRDGNRSGPQSDEGSSVEGAASSVNKNAVTENKSVQEQSSPRTQPIKGKSEKVKVSDAANSQETGAEPKKRGGWWKRLIES